MAWWRSLQGWTQSSPFASHLMRALDRYLNRLGNQLAASIAFFSVLAVVPLLMFAFSALGLTLTVIRPGWLDGVRQFIIQNLNAGPLQDQVLLLLREYLGNWRNIGLVALVIALIIGSTWMANVKGAIRGMTRPDFDMSERNHPVLLEPLINLMLVLVFMVLVAVSFTATAVGTRLAGDIVDWLRLGDVLVSRGLVSGASLLASLAGATVLFWLIFRFLPAERAPRPAVQRGSLGAGVCFVALQAGASALGGVFSGGRVTQVFGPIIVAMLFLNVFAQLILFFAAWVATWNQPAVARRYNPADEILRSRENTVAVEHHWRYADTDRAMRGLLPLEARSGRAVPQDGKPAEGDDVSGGPPASE